MQPMSCAICWVPAVYVPGPLIFFASFEKEKRKARAKIRTLVCTCVAENHLCDLYCWELGDSVDVFRN
jgi:hypothetical protein